MYCSFLRVLIFAAFSISASFGEDPQEPRELTELIEELGTAYIRRPMSVGLSIGVFAQEQTSFYNFGKVATDSPKTPDENTVFEIGSISKTFTGTLVSQAVKNQRVKLDDDIRDYLDADYANLEYEGVPIKLFHLLNHTSGLPFQLPHDQKAFENMTAEDSVKLAEIQGRYSKQDLLEDLHNITLKDKPGEKLSYSNTAAQLLGLILENVNGISYSELLEREICVPLGLQNTQGSIDTDVENRAKGYNNKKLPMPSMPKSLAAAGGISSTTSDLLKYARFHLDERNEVVALSHQPTWGEIQYYAIGLNWQMEKKAGMPYRIWQSGGTGGFSSVMILYPESDVAIVMLSNESDKDAQGLLSEMASKMFDSISGGH